MLLLLLLLLLLLVVLLRLLPNTKSLLPGESIADKVNVAAAVRLT